MKLPKVLKALLLGAIVLMSLDASAFTAIAHVPQNAVTTLWRVSIQVMDVEPNTLQRIPPLRRPLR
jgi:hypothetical protein